MKKFKSYYIFIILIILLVNIVYSDNFENVSKTECN